MNIGWQFYDSFMKPLETLRLANKRSQLLKDVSGDVLEIGYGSGANLKYYDYDQLDSMTLIDQKITSHLNTNMLSNNLAFNIDAGDVQNLPYKDESFDSIVFTLVFCSVKDPLKGLEEIKRVLKPEGRIYFIEHILPTRTPYKEMFSKLTPLWKTVAHNCHLNRETVHLIQQTDLQLIDYHRFFRTSFATGIAVKR